MLLPDPIAILRWTMPEDLKSAHYVYRVPFQQRVVESIEFYRKVTAEELACFRSCLPDDGRWRMAGDFGWKSIETLHEVLADGE